MTPVASDNATHPVVMTRRRLMQLLGGAALVLPAAIASTRTIFLPPTRGWLAPLARMEVPPSDIGPWDLEIAAGNFTYDRATHMLDLWYGLDDSQRRAIHHDCRAIQILPPPSCHPDKDGRWCPPLWHAPA
jgi:hypothetical protein